MENAGCKVVEELGRRGTYGLIGGEWRKNEDLKVKMLSFGDDVSCDRIRFYGRVLNITRKGA